MRDVNWPNESNLCIWYDTSEQLNDMTTHIIPKTILKMDCHLVSIFSLNVFDICNNYIGFE